MVYGSENIRKDSKEIFITCCKYVLRNLKNIPEQTFTLIGCHCKVNLAHLLLSPL